MDFFFGIVSGDIIYDIETYPNAFTFIGIHAKTGTEWCFEISTRKNELKQFILFLIKIQEMNCRMVGFNNISFDYPVIHYIFQNYRLIDVDAIYKKSMQLINTEFDNKHSNRIRDKDIIIPQIDLFLIHHFDNPNKFTSLKVLEFNMRSSSIENLPFDVGLTLTNEQIDELIRYNRHDVKETLKFYNLSQKQIAYREKLSNQYGKNFMNHSDVKIGTDFFITNLEQKLPGSCYTRVNGKREVRQTIRKSITLNDVILPYIRFTHPGFLRILSFFRSKTITETKGVFKGLICQIKDVKYTFGTGGIHASIEKPEALYADDEYAISEWDVQSYYPSLAISNGFYPEHLGKDFCSIYKEVYDLRNSYPKGSEESTMLKFALNGVYGNSNNQYSPFFDAKYTMSITVNGQLLLCMIAEALMQEPSVRILQINTDAFTIRYPRKLLPWLESVNTWWENMTGCHLNKNDYDRIFIRNVNSYMAQKTDGTLKRIKEYEHDREWYQDHSALIIPKAAEAALIHGKDIVEFIKNHDDVMDFMMRTKLKRDSQLEWGGVKQQNVTRYYVSTDGDYLEKVSPPKGKEGDYKRASKIDDRMFDRIKKEVGDMWDPRIHTKNKSRYTTRREAIQAGYTVQLCNSMEGRSDFSDINYDFYIKGARDLVDKLKGRR